MKSLFVASTPYQCLTAATISLSNGGNDDIIILKLFSIDDELIDNLRRIFKNVYVSCDFNDNGKKSFLQQLRFVISLKKLIRKCKNKDYQSIFTSNDNLVFNQCIVNKLKTQEMEYIHFEDGSFEYKNSDGTGFSALKWFLLKVKWTTLLMTHIRNYDCIDKSIEKVYLTFPTYRRKCLLELQPYQISRSQFIESIKLLYQPQKINQKIIFCLDHSECGKDIIESSINMCEFLLSICNDVAIKYHPRERYKYIKNEKVFNIDPALPFEAVALGFNGIIISNNSSILHTIKFMNPDSVIICTALMLNQQEDDYIKFLQKIGVLFPGSLSEFKEMITFC